MTAKPDQRAGAPLRGGLGRPLRSRPLGGRQPARAMSARDHDVTAPLDGLAVLVVEDDYMIAREVADELARGGASVVGPVPNVEEALALLSDARIDVALLDINLAGRPSFPVADALKTRAIPFMFTSGYAPNSIPEAYRSVRLVEKPFRPEDLIRTVAQLSGSADGLPDEAPRRAPPNKLLATLSREDLIRLRQHTTRVRVRAGEELVAANQPFERVYFPESGVLSALASLRADRAEVGLIGCEGMAGSSLALDVDRTPMAVVAQLDGEAVTMAASEFRRLVGERPALHQRILRYHHVFGLQVTYTALANASLTIDERLARWLLMCSDRVGDEIRVVHEFLAAMLNVRRAGVTNALHVLEGEGAIRSLRGRILIRDRAKLTGIAGSSYGVPEAEYRRLLEL